MDANKKIGLKAFVFVLFCGVCAAALLKNVDPDKGNGTLSKSTQTETPQNSTSFDNDALQSTTDINGPADSSSSEAVEVSTRPDWLTEPSLHELSKFQFSRGHFQRSDAADYQSYGLQTLYELAESNDFVAVHVLAEKLHTSGKREEAYNTYKHAAVLGSTAALGKLAGFHNSKYFLNAGNANEEEQKEMLIEVLSLYKVAEIRGDRSMITDANAFLESTGHTISDEHSQEITRRAHIMYEELNASRERLGLGEFDNFVPEHVVKYYDSMHGDSSR